jgi:hypothetical protein
MAFPGDNGSHFQFMVAITTATTTSLVPAVARWTPPQASALSALSESAGAVAGGSVITTTNSWTIDQWIGYRIRITSGADAGSTYVIGDNDATTLTIVGTLAHDVAIGNTFEIQTPSGWVPVIRSMILSCASATAGTLTFRSNDTARQNADMPTFNIPTTGLQFSISNALFLGIVNGNIEVVTSTAQAIRVSVEGDYVKASARNVA